MKKIIAMATTLVMCLYGVPQGTLKPKKHSRAQLRDIIVDSHCCIPRCSWQLEQTRLNNDRQFFELSMSLLDPSEHNPISKASLKELEEHANALEHYQRDIKQAEQLLLNARKHLEQSPLNQYTNK